MGLKELKRMRESWAKRENDPLIARLDEHHKPLPFPAAPASERSHRKVAQLKATLGE